MRLLRTFVLTMMVGAWAVPALAQAPDGAAVFQRACASCHCSRRSRLAGAAPRHARDDRARSHSDSLTSGKMFRQGTELTDAERRAVAGVPGRPAARHRGAAVHRRPLHGRSSAPCGRGDRRGLERLGRRHHQYPLPGGQPRRAHRRAGAAAQAEVGVRLSRRQLGPRTAGRRRRSPLRRQRERRRLRARREDRLHLLDLSRAAGHPHGDVDRPVQNGRQVALYFADGGAAPTRWIRSPAASSGRPRWTITPTPQSTGSPTLHNGRLYVADGRRRRGRTGRPRQVPVLHVPRQRQRRSTPTPARSSGRPT